MGWKPSCISPKNPIKKLASQILITLSVCRCSRKNPDFRSYTLIRYKLGKAVTNIHQDLTIIFPESCPTIRTIQRWNSEIQSGTFTLEKGVSSGRSLETMTPEAIACVKELIIQNPRMSTWEPTADLSLPHTAVYEILKKDLMAFKWSSAVGHLTSSQIGTRRRELSAVRRWLCCTRPMDSFFCLPSVSTGWILVLLGQQRAEGSLGGAIHLDSSSSSGRQTKWSKFGWRAFLWVDWVKCQTLSNPKLPKKHDTVNHFGPSQMVLELINIRQSFPNNLIIFYCFIFVKRCFETTF